MKEIYMKDKIMKLCASNPTIQRMNSDRRIAAIINELHKEVEVTFDAAKYHVMRRLVDIVSKELRGK